MRGVEPPALHGEISGDRISSFLPSMNTLLLLLGTHYAASLYFCRSYRCEIWSCSGMTKLCLFRHRCMLPIWTAPFHLLSPFSIHVQHNHVLHRRTQLFIKLFPFLKLTSRIYSAVRTSTWHTRHLETLVPVYLPGLMRIIFNGPVRTAQ